SRLNLNIQSTLEKVLEEQLKQLKQRISLDNLKKSNEELKHEVLENQKLLQNILTTLTSGSAMTPMMKAYHKLFQINKNPSDAEVKHAFKLQIQFTNPTEVVQWKKLEKVTKAKCDLWKKVDDNDPNSPCIIEIILQRAFSKEELQNENNIKF
ncbi:4942_t:CDS:2, partial [Funneliformis caledonium]